MKNSLYNKVLLSISLVVSSSCLAAEPATEEANAELSGDISYYFGYSLGNNLQQTGNADVDPEKVLLGLRHSLAAMQPALSEDQQRAVLEEVQRRRIEIQQQRMDGLAEAARTFLEYNAKQEGIIETASGLQYQVLQEGTGASPTAEDSVLAHYEGRLVNDSVFDSSIARGEPVTFPLSRVIAGWTEGLQLMKEGGKTRFFIPPELGYGPGGTQNIPPNSVLIFDVELLEVNPEAGQ